MARTPTGLTGTAGEYHVAAELSRRGWLATVTIKNSPGTDVLAQKLEPPSRLVAIQTKTTSKGNARYLLKDSEERLSDRLDEWFVFVALREITERPDFYVVPRNVVACRLYSDYQNWIHSPGRGGRQRNPTTTRDLDVVQIVGYRERWDLLDQPTTAAPFPRPDWWLEIARQWPRPEGYEAFGISGSG
jgi:hypothetical protein